MDFYMMDEVYQKVRIVSLYLIAHSKLGILLKSQTF